jgi:hypothetical protein
MGVITRVAGTGTAGNTGDDGLAADAQLNNPAGLAVTGDGGFLIADFGSQVVRKVSADGVITRVAETGCHPGGRERDRRDRRRWRPGHSRPTTGPCGCGGDQRWWIPDFRQRRPRGAQGVRGRGDHQVAGTGRPETPVMGLATDAQLNNPNWVAVTTDGGFLIADFCNHEIRNMVAG